MIFFGSRTLKTEVNRGLFACPVCDTETGYRLLRTRKWGHLYWVPILPMGDINEVMECQKCRNAFVPRIGARSDDEPSSEADLEQLTYLALCSSLMAKMLAIAEDTTDVGIDAFNETRSALAGNKLPRQSAVEMVDKLKGSNFDVGAAVTSYSGSKLDLERKLLLVDSLLLVGRANSDLSRAQTSLFYEVVMCLGIPKAELDHHLRQSGQMRS